MPRISIILPVFNGEAFLAECIDSVLAQSLDDFELLIGDDGSTDASHAILARYQDPRIRTFLNEQNVCLFANLNRLTARATAPLVRFLCQDDALEPCCLADETTYFDANPKIVMSICAVYAIDQQGKVTGEWPTGEGPWVFDGAWCLQKLFYEGCIAGNLSTVCLRRGCLESAGPFDETYEVAGDYEMWVRVCQFGWVADRQDKLIRLRQHKGRLSEAKFSGVKFVKENRRVIAQLTPLLPPEIQTAAWHYNWWRHNVFDTNYFVRCAVKGKFAECRELVRIMGLRSLLPGLAAWLITVNNRLYMPKRFYYEASP